MCFGQTVCPRHDAATQKSRATYIFRFILAFQIFESLRVRNDYAVGSTAQVFGPAASALSAYCAVQLQFL